MARIDLFPYKCALCLGPQRTLRAVRDHLKETHGVLSKDEQERYVEAMRNDAVIRAARELEGR